MGQGYIVRGYRTMPPEDRRTFERWLKANTIIGLIVFAGLIAMALAGSNSVTPRDTKVAKNISAFAGASQTPHSKSSLIRK